MDEFKFERVLAPIRIGTMDLRNRFVMPPMVTNFAAEDGSVTERLKWYHKTRAKGGVGLIITEASYVDQAAKGFKNQLGIHKDELIPGLRKLTEAVHLYGAKIAIQLYHAGRQTTSMVNGDRIVAPSAIPCPVKQEMPHELTVEEIKELVGHFRQAARRAKAAGFDAVEIHGAHGYLLNQFLSPYSNKRTDEYGGTFANRMRFPLEVIQSVREEVGENYPIIYRLSAEEYVHGGLTIEDTKIWAKILVEAGVNAIHVTGGVYESSPMIIQPAAIPQGVYAENAARIKEAINGAVPVIVVGRIKTPEMAERIIRDGRADMVAMGRALLGDPELPRKTAEGRTAAIRNCIGCNQGCIDRLFQDKDISCMINPLTGHEAEYDLAAPVNEKKVLIIGGGPGGLEAARVASLRGHNTILFEKENELGGQLRIAAKPPHKDEINDLLWYLINEVEKSSTEIVTGVEADLTTVRKINPDVVILAAGSEEIIPAIPGIFRENVVTGHEVLRGSAHVGNRVVVIGGGMVGCETAEFLADQGKQVIIVEKLEDIALDVGPLTRGLLLNRMADKDITVLTNRKVSAILSDRLRVEKGADTEIIAGIDTFVVAAGARPISDLAQGIKHEGIPVFAIGDAREPRRIYEAIHEGFRAAYTIGIVPIGQGELVWN